MRCALQIMAVVLALSSSWAESAELGELVSGGSKPGKVAGDCKFTEGPAWSPAGFLVFSDIPNNRVVRIAADGTISDFLNPSGRSNGLVFDGSGRLYLCQSDPPGIARIDDPVKKGLSAIAPSFEGKPFNSPNDLALDDHGGLYFTDPRYGQDMKLSQPVMGVYYVAESGKITRVIEDLERPNGILVANDGKTLYVAEPNRRELYAYEILEPGVLTAGRLIFRGDARLDGGGPDGMTLDEHGNIYATYGSVVVLSPQGDLIGRIEVPERPANVTFGGADGKTLYITARTSVYALPMQVSGAPLFPAGKLPGKPTASRGISSAQGAGFAQEKEKKETDKAEPKTQSVKARDLTLVVPEDWKKQDAIGLRVAQLAIPPVEKDKEKGDGEYVVFYFPNGAGDATANVQRWVGQFDAEGRKVKVFTGTSKYGKYTLADISGTFNKSIGPPIAGRTKKLEGWRVLAVVLETGDEMYYLRFDAPQATAADAEDAFRRSFGANPKDEKEVQQKAEDK